QALSLQQQALVISNKEKDLQRLAYLKEKAEKQEKQQQLNLSEKEMQLQATKLDVLGKEKDLQQTQLEFSLSEIKSKSVQRNLFIAGTILMLLLAGSIFLGLKRTRKEKMKSDALLLNILPEETANELKETGSAVAKSYHNVTVIFTDFVNFTGISETMSPTELVAEIHKYFTAFDAIIESNGLEKIKTIGDAYLAVCGLPVETKDHAHKVTKAAKEICDYMQSIQGNFQIRIGLNSGPVVAGIVGVKKFAYDIWGDTVNTASRIESNSEAGRINISGATYELIKNDFACTHRGKISAKNKGEIDMYFVD
ncbi:MAG: adenylate/guanylate cyclase domain-containing protein, partial [bacterium]|nr:adenylate/guanylate cyclase domain-containing protein [bacterium]